MKKIILPLILFCLFENLLAQEVSVFPQPTDLITVPTAGIMPRGAYMIGLNFYHNGGVVGGISSGISNKFMFGISFGGFGIIGNDEITWNKQPGVQIKYRLVDESMAAPALLIGFNSRGYGSYIDSLDRYENKAKGFYAVCSKNFQLLGNFGLHGGINYNPIEIKDGDKDPSFFVGLDKDINSELSVVLEYDAALNDNEKNVISLGKGYLNAGIRWSFAQNFHFELDFNNILLNHDKVEFVNREFKLTFIEFF